MKKSLMELLEISSKWDFSRKVILFNFFSRHIKASVILSELIFLIQNKHQAAQN